MIEHLGNKLGMLRRQKKYKEETLAERYFTSRRLW